MDIPEIRHRVGLFLDLQDRVGCSYVSKVWGDARPDVFLGSKILTFENRETMLRLIYSGLSRLPSSGDVKSMKAVFNMMLKQIADAKSLSPSNDRILCIPPQVVEIVQAL